MTIDQLSQARTLVRQLSFHEKVSLLNELTIQVIQHSTKLTPLPSVQPLPTIHLAQWPVDLPLRREELYDDRNR
jgi:hypothetical protein